MFPFVLAIILVGLLTMSGLAAIAYLFPQNHPQD